MIKLDDSMREREENWTGEQMKGMNINERREFLSECADFLFCVDKYSTGKLFERFYKEKEK